jgi:hypothetical protein
MMLQRPIRRFSAAIAAAAALSLSLSAFAFTPPPFPRLGAVANGGNSNYGDSSFQDEAAKMSVMMFGYWPGATWGGETMETIVKSIKSKNPNALVFLYTDMDGMNTSGTDSMSPLRNKINSMNWWLHDGTNLVPSFYGHGEYTIDSTPYTAKDSSGNDAVDWIAKWYVSTYYTPNPDIDGFFMDNVFPHPRVSGDWTNSGSLLQATDSGAASALQAGYERWYSLVNQLMPGKYQIGNIGSWETMSTTPPAGYQGMTNGGVLEAIIGQSYSIESWGGWKGMMNEYNTSMQASSAPKLVIFNQWGNPTDYQSFRYGLTSCLMNDGYYSFTSFSAGYNGIVWFDEYNTNLGAEVSTPPTSAWQKGVWRRDFTNGIALVNPKGNGPQTVSLGGTFFKIKGSQDPAVNSGQTVTSVTLQDRDGIILLRQSALQQPKAPTQITASSG